MKYTFLIAGILLTGCQSRSPIFEAGISKGVIQSNKIREASGLAASVNNPGMLWTHNDSGNASDIFLLNERGEITCTVHLPGIKNRDWEDIAIGAGPQEGKQYIYIAEIGDNNAVYDTKFLYRIEEPRIPEGVTDTTLSQIDQIKFRLTDGARDTETLMMDPVSKNFYVLSKRESRVNLYQLAGPLTTTDTLTAVRVLEKLPFTLIVGGDISKDGQEILLKNYDHVFYWKRLTGESIEDALKRSPEKLPYTPEPQGESIAFDPGGTGYYTISERKNKAAQHLNFYKRK